MKSISRFIAVLVTGSALLVSCMQSGSKSSEATNGEAISKEEIKQDVEDVLFPIPDPIAFFQMLEDIGASYQAKVFNPVSNAESYFQDNVKAINLGVYGADLSYATAYEDKEHINAYTRTMKKLIDDLGIKVDYSFLLEDETKDLLADHDSLVSLTTNVFYETYEFLHNESDPSLAALMVNGFYIEGLYISTHISEDTYNNLEMVKLIYEQSKPLEKLMSLNAKFEGNQYLETIQGALAKLKALYDETDGSLNEEQLNKIMTTIADIRATIVS